jgi:hypothetical protein
MKPDPAPYVTQRQAALLLEVTPTRIRQMDRSGHLQRYQVRRNVIGYLLHDVRALLIRKLRSEWTTECQYLQRHHDASIPDKGDQG